MTPRTIRRAAERKALKQARKADRLLAPADPDSRAATPVTIPVDGEASPSTARIAVSAPGAIGSARAKTAGAKTNPGPGFAGRVLACMQEIGAKRETRLSEARIAINRANAQLSTGPKTPAGKAVSCLNNTRYGLTGTLFTVLEWEDRADFDQLLSSLQDEYHPSTATEQILVEKIAQHHWLGQRALLLQNLCFDSAEPRCENEADQKQLALFFRYQTTHERAFHKCIDQLLKIRAAKQKEANGFESQKRRQAAEVRRQETHEGRVRIANARAAHQELLTEGRRTACSRLPNAVTPEKAPIALHAGENLPVDLSDTAAAS